MENDETEDSADKTRASHLKRRRLDAEIFMLQSDRSRLERQSNELEAEVRMFEKAINEKEAELEARKSQRSHIIQKIQDIDAEILRVKRSTYKKDA